MQVMIARNHPRCSGAPVQNDKRCSSIWQKSTHLGRTNETGVQENRRFKSPGNAEADFGLEYFAGVFFLCSHQILSRAVQVEQESIFSQPSWMHAKESIRRRLAPGPRSLDRTAKQSEFPMDSFVMAFPRLHKIVHEIYIRVVVYDALFKRIPSYIAGVLLWGTSSQLIPPKYFAYKIRVSISMICVQTLKCTNPWESCSLLGGLHRFRSLGMHAQFPLLAAWGRLLNLWQGGSSRRHISAHHTEWLSWGSELSGWQGWNEETEGPEADLQHRKPHGAASNECRNPQIIWTLLRPHRHFLHRSYQGDWW